jgi:hypothetical protein
MRIEKTVDLGSMQVRVKEITVGELRNLLAQDVAGFNAMEWVAGRAALPPDLVGAFTDLTPEMIPKLTFSEMQTIIEAVKEVNAAFFFVIEKLGMLAGFIQEIRENGSRGSQQA